VAALREALQDREWRVRRRAAIAMGRLERRETFASLQRALEQDPASQVRAYAARALGALETRRAVPLLRAALEDEDPFVRCLAAQSLVTRFGKKDGIDALIALLDWENPRMRDRWVRDFLVDLTGRPWGSKRERWASWWQESRAEFPMNAHRKTFEQLREAREAKAEGDEDKALRLYRKLRRKLPRHKGIAKDLAEILNSKAWSMALAGEQLPEALAMAQESVEADPNPMNIDTLAVLQFLTGDATAAAETLRQAVAETEDAAARKQYETRLREIEAGSLKL